MKKIRVNAWSHIRLMDLEIPSFVGNIATFVAHDFAARASRSTGR